MNISPISCIIVDDEAFAGELIANMVKDIPFLDLKCTTTSPLEGIRKVATGHVELVLLDMGMAELHGVEFMKATQNKCRIIVITAYPRYALEGYEYDVIDFLVKPVSFVKLLRAAEKARKLLRGAHAETEINWVFLRRPEDNGIERNSRNDRIRVNVSDILYIESDRNRIIVHTEHEPISGYMTLQAIEEMLPRKKFVQVHRRYIVSLTKIYKVDSEFVYIKNKAIPIGQRFHKEFFKRI